MNNKIEKQFRYPNRIPIDDIASLRLLLGKEPNDYVILLGKIKSLDGDGREYSWLPDSVDTDDGDNIIRPTMVESRDPGRWQKVGKIATADGTFKGQKTTITGIGSAASFYIEHPFNTLDVMVEVYKITTLETVEVGVVRSLGGITIKFKVAPDSGEQFKVLIITF